MQPSVDYTRKNGKGIRHLRLAVYPDGRVIVTAPSWIRESVIHKLMADKSSWLLKKIAYFKKQASAPRRELKIGSFDDHKREALVFVKRRLEEVNQQYQFSCGKISVRNQKTRWGSCSKKGNLQFNYRIIALPSHLAEYLIVHELCHLKEFNHSKNFWQLVEQTIPDYRLRRRELKGYRLSS